MPEDITISDTEFHYFRNYLENQCCIHIEVDKKYLVDIKLSRLVEEEGCASFTDLYNKAVNDGSNRLRDRIIDAITIKETLWFRDVKPFSALENVILKKMAEDISSGKRSSIRIWSAGCSTGQEPYSIAMTILEFCKTQHTLRPEHVEIIATDISHRAVAESQEGRYDSMIISRGLPDTMRDRYFELDGNMFLIKDEVKNMVTFRQENLHDSSKSMGKLDVIFCRNVLLYLSDTFRKEFLHDFAKLLGPSGYLFLGGSECLLNYTDEYEMILNPGCTYYMPKDAI